MSEIMEDPDDETWVDLTEDEDEIEIEEEDNSSDDDDDDDSSNDDELEEVSDRVKSRIEAMRQEALRERQAREALAKNAKDVEGLADRLRKENEHLKKAYSEGEKVYIEQARNRVDAAIAAAKKDYKAAFETGDSDAVAEIQVAIADLMTQRNEIARVRHTKGDAAYEPLQVVHPSQVAPEARAHLVAVLELCYGREPRFDLLNVEQRIQDPLAQLAACHGGDRMVQHRQQRTTGGTIVDVLHQFQVPLARAVQDQIGLHEERPDAPDVGKRGLLRFFDIPERSACR